MNVVNEQDPIEIQALRVGMFVHLDVGWMSHPFPVSSFKIATQEQIDVIRSLGLKRVRWSRKQSDAFAAVPPPAVHAAANDAKLTSDPAVDAARQAANALARERDAHRNKLAAERAGLALCERQYAEAAKALRSATDMVPIRPLEAKAQSVALCKALIGKMVGDTELCIRLLSESVGDKASQHALNVTIISLLMGRTFSLADADLEDIGVGALLHDIGKTELPDRVRHREDHFSHAELRFYEEHVAHGVALSRKMQLSPGASLVVAQHHESADGTGFPLKLNTDRMTPGARIVSLVNRYDNLCNPNLAALALTPHEALSTLFAQGKSKFDTAILGAFIKMMGVYPPGSTVQLTDDRYAQVIAVNSSRPLRPRVLVHDSKVPRDMALTLDLESTPGVGIRRSVKPAQLPPASLQYLAPRPRVAYFFEPVTQPEAA